MNISADKYQLFVVLINEVIVAYKSCHSIFHDQMEQFRVVSTPLLNYLEVNIKVLGVNRIESDFVFGFIVKNVDYFDLFPNFFYIAFFFLYRGFKFSHLSQILHRYNLLNVYGTIWTILLLFMIFFWQSLFIKNLFIIYQKLSELIAQNFLYKKTLPKIYCLEKNIVEYK